MSEAQQWAKVRLVEIAQVWGELIRVKNARNKRAFL